MCFQLPYPLLICPMYGIFTHLRLECMLNVGKYAVRPMGRIWACNWGSTEGNAAAQTEVGGCEDFFDRR